MRILNKKVLDIRLASHDKRVIKITNKNGDILYQYESQDIDYLCLTNTYNGTNTVTITKTGEPAATNLEYSKNKSTWTNIDLTQTSTNIDLLKGERIYLRGINEGINSSTTDYISIKANQTNNVSGHIMSILDYQHITTAEMNNWCFTHLFRDNTKLIDASSLVLPSYTFTHSFYALFRGCSSLTGAPTLPATALSMSCYMYMFEHCSSLVTPPSLPATELADYCYDNMFASCTSLTTAPSLPVMTLRPYCYYSMFNGCTSLTNTPELPATTLANYCYRNMFYGCTSLTNTPELPATTLAIESYRGMFYGCSLVNYVKMNVTNWDTTNAANWLENVADTGVVECPSNSTIPLNSASGVPVGWSKVDDVDYLCLTNTYNGTNTVTITKSGTPNATNLEYSKNKSTWTNIDLTQTSTNIDLLKGERIYLRGINENGFSKNTSNYLYIKANNTHNVSGNIMSILDYQNIDTVELHDYDFYYLFYINSKLIDASELQLSATTLANNCYQSMFYNCILLTTAPTLPATNLADSCYWGMFSNCSSLTTAPTLPATNLANKCYQNMFDGCSSLTTAPTLPATNLANYCYQSMFNGCSLLTEAPELPATTLVYGCYWGMFSYCTGLTEVPELPATTLAYNCYEEMFKGCTGLTTAPTLPVTTLAGSCYREMFKGCTGLTEVPELPATTLANDCYYGMFTNCTSLTDTPELPATTLAGSCYREMFKGCTGLTTAPELPATTMTEYCYNYMFSGCVLLNYVKMNITNWVRDNAWGWLENVADTGVVECPTNSTIPLNSTSGVPTGWTKVTF